MALINILVAVAFDLNAVLRRTGGALDVAAGSSPDDQDE